MKLSPDLCLKIQPWMEIEGERESHERKPCYLDEREE
jgi:hypothetical protein